MRKEFHLGKVNTSIFLLVAGLEDPGWDFIQILVRILELLLIWSIRNLRAPILSNQQQFLE